MSRRSAAALVLLVVASCGGGGTRLSEELGAVTHVIEIPPDALEVTGRDVSGNATPSERGQPRLDILRIDLDRARVVTTFGESVSLPDPQRLVRDPLPHGALVPVVAGADRLLLLAIPLLTPTREGVEHDARVIGLDASGAVVSADWTGRDFERLEALLDDSADPAATLAEAVRAIAAETLGQELTAEQRRLLALVQG